MTARTRRIIPVGLLGVVVLAGGLAARHAAAGPAVRTILVGRSPWAVAVDERTRRAFVIVVGPFLGAVPAGPGSVSEVDPASGRVLRTVTVGVDPLSVAVDGRTGLVFVANNGGTITVPDPWGWIPSWLRGRLPFLPPPGLHAQTVPGSVSVFAAAKV